MYRNDTVPESLYQKTFDSLISLVDVNGVSRNDAMPESLYQKAFNSLISLFNVNGVSRNDTIGIKLN